MKPIRLSSHARLQANLRGAADEEVYTAIREGTRKDAKKGSFRARHPFDFNSFSPVNNQFYKHKAVEVIFKDNPDEIVVITVKVYYYNEEAT